MAPRDTRCPSSSAQPPAAGGRFPGLVCVRAWKSPSVPPAKGVSAPALQRTTMGRQRKPSLCLGRGEGSGQLLSPLQTVHPGSSSHSKTSLRWLHQGEFLFPNWLFQFVPYLRALGNQNKLKKNRDSASKAMAGVPCCYRLGCGRKMTSFRSHLGSLPPKSCAGASVFNGTGRNSHFSKALFNMIIERLPLLDLSGAAPTEVVRIWQAFSPHKPYFTPGLKATLFPWMLLL